MGNNRSRVAPSRTLRILDSETRARFKNQREAAQLRFRLQDIQSKHKEALSRLVLDQHEIKAQLREYKYEAEQRKFFESFEQKKPEETTKENGSRKSSTSTTLVSSDVDEVDESIETIKLESSTLLLHDLDVGSQWEKTRFVPHHPNKALLKARPLSTFEARRLQFASKLDARQIPSEQIDSSLQKDSLSLLQHSNLLKSTIKVAVARAARDSHTAARRDVHVY